MNAFSNWFKKLTSDPQLVLLLILLTLTTALLILFAKMLAPAIAAVVIAFLLDGPRNWLCEKGFSNIASVTLVFIVFIFTAVVTLLAVIPPLINQIVAFLENSPAILMGLRDGLLSLQERFPELLSESQVNDWITRITDEVASFGPRILEYSLSGITGAITVVVYLVLVPVMVFFFLKDKENILTGFSSFLPQDRRLTEEVWHEITAKAGDYARGKVYEILIFSSISFVAYQIIGLRFATLLAVISGLSVLIPYIGAAAATLPIALVAYFQWGWAPEAATAIIVYLVLQALDGNLLAPLLFSEVVKLHPNAIIVAILVFGGLWGFWGVFFAIPLATVANAVIRAWRESVHGAQPVDANSSS